MKSIFIKISCFIMIFSLPIFAQFVADSNTVALYHFDERNGNIVTDASGKNNNSRLNNNNAWTTDGKFGSALKLNGSSDYVMIPDNPAQSPTKGFTIEAWIKIISYPSGQTNSSDNTGTIIHKGIDNDWIHETYHLRLLNNGKLSFISERANTCGGIIASYIQLTSNSILSQNQWYNIAVTFDSLTNTGKLYIDNLLDTLSLAQMGQHYTQTCTLPITIGADTLTNPNGIINYFDGYIDELRISDIARQYNLIDTNTVAFYHFDESSGDSVYDSSGNMRNGIAYGTKIVDGFLGNAREFNGSSDKIEVPAFNPQGSFTIEAYVNLDTPTVAEQIYPIIGHGVYDFGKRGYLLWVGRDQDGKSSIIFWANSDDGNTTIFLVNTKDVSKFYTGFNEWHHIAGVWDGYIARVYVDGVLWAEASGNSTTQIGLNNYPTLIGSDYFPTGNKYISGKIDEVKFSKNNTEFVSTDSVSYTVYPSQNTFLIPSDFSAAVTVKLPPDIYDVTASFNSAHAGGDLDGVFFAAQTGETTTKWPRGHAILESLHTSKTTIDVQNAPDTVTGYLFFEDGSDLSDNPGNVVITFKSTTTNNTINYTVYPNQNTLLIPANFSTALAVKLAPGAYDVTALFNGAHAGGDLDGVFFAAHTGETSAQWPQGHSILESFHTTKTTISLSDAPDSVTGYLFFEDGSNLGDNPGSVTVTFVKTSATYIAIESAKIPSDFNLGQNYPNPFNPTTTIIYELPKSNLVKLKVFDVLGRDVATLVNEEKPAGRYQVHFDASKLSSGVYFYRMEAGDFVQSKKLILLK